MRRIPPLSSPHAAFTLVEMAVVLALIGLLVGGILGGQALLRSAELNRVTTEFASYQNAYNQFQVQYSAIPGDMLTATRYWNSAGGTGSDTTCRNTNSLGSTGTCNGDGDRLIDTASNEMFRAWQQLANAKLIEGSYTGTAYVSGQASSHRPGTNCPEGRIAGSGWSMLAIQSNHYTSTFFSRNHGNVAVFGGAISNDITAGGILAPGDAYSIDRKYDDGMPGTGKVETNFTTCTMASANTTYSAAYNTRIGTPSCALLFRLD